MKLRIQCWHKSEPPSERELREKFADEGLSPYAWSNAPGDNYSEHYHRYDKVLYIAHGSITWIFPSLKQEFETHAGDRIDLPRGLMHAVRVGSHGVICLEAHID
ncbi:cupin [Candidatus Acetothermia bacterium]|nr:cupin [Candidatus Acetothermia bacterium]